MACVTLVNREALADSHRRQVRTRSKPLKQPRVEASGSLGMFLDDRTWIGRRRTRHRRAGKGTERRIDHQQSVELIATILGFDPRQGADLDCGDGKEG